MEPATFEGKMLVVIKIKHVGLCSLNKILPEKLCLKANLPRKTVHCLCITCATRLFQHNVGDKLAREQTGHKSNALFSYQKPSEKELDDVSNVLGAVIAFTETENERSSVKDELPKPTEHAWMFFPKIFSRLIPHLTNIPVPENTLTSNINNFCANSVFNNCTINFCCEKK